MEWIMFDPEKLEELVGRSVGILFSGVRIIGTVTAAVPAYGGQITVCSVLTGTPYTVPVSALTEWS
jgi:hypothetical protein